LLSSRCSRSALATASEAVPIPAESLADVDSSSQIVRPPSTSPAWRTISLPLRRSRGAAKPPLAVLTIDLWNTLFVAHGECNPREAQVDELVASANADEHTRSVFAQAYDEAELSFQAGWRSGVLFTARDAAELIVAHTVPLWRSDDPAEQAFAALVRGGRHAQVGVVPGAALALLRARQRGLRLALISDVGLVPVRAIESQLKRHGLRELFDCYVFSDDTGVYKPDPVPFRRALDAVGRVAPHRAAHIGDMRRSDVAGAQRIGMHAVRFNAVFDDPESDPVEDALLSDWLHLECILDDLESARSRHSGTRARPSSRRT
jgi:FMN phosphatase YigB (HAD superfamily)